MSHIVGTRIISSLIIFFPRYTFRFKALPMPPNAQTRKQLVAGKDMAIVRLMLEALTLHRDRDPDLHVNYGLDLARMMKICHSFFSVVLAMMTFDDTGISVCLTRSLVVSISFLFPFPPLCCPFLKAQVCSLLHLRSSHRCPCRSQYSRRAAGKKVSQVLLRSYRAKMTHSSPFLDLCFFLSTRASALMNFMLAPPYNLCHVGFIMHFNVTRICSGWAPLRCTPHVPHVQAQRGRLPPRNLACRCVNVSLPAYACPH